MPDTTLSTLNETTTETITAPDTSNPAPETTPLAWERHKGLVYHIVRRSGVPWAELEEAVDDAMICLWRASRRYDPARGSEAGFVAAVTRKSCLTYLRQKRRRSRETTQADVFLTETPAPDLLAERTEPRDTAAVRAALKELCDESQEALRLRYAVGLSESEAAKAAGIDIRALRSRIDRALLELRVAMGPAAADEHAA